jgi:hypothetical protein
VIHHALVILVRANALTPNHRQEAMRRRAETRDYVVLSQVDYSAPNLVATVRALDHAHDRAHAPAPETIVALSRVRVLRQEGSAVVEREIQPRLPLSRLHLWMGLVEVLEGGGMRGARQDSESPAWNAGREEGMVEHWRSWMVPVRVLRGDSCLHAAVRLLPALGVAAREGGMRGLEVEEAENGEINCGC